MPHSSASAWSFRSLEGLKARSFGALECQLTHFKNKNREEGAVISVVREGGVVTNLTPYPCPLRSLQTIII